MALRFPVQLALLITSHIATCTPHTLHIDYQDDDDSSWVTLPIIHGTNEEHFGKRGVEVELANRSDVAYYASLDIGTPPQQNFVQLDTGSFELWVAPDCSSLRSQGDVRFCQAAGTYDSASSSTSELSGETNTLRYGIGSAEIEYVKDDISLTGSNSVLKAVRFGRATATEHEFSGILGIGYGENITIDYPNFVDQLQLQGVTKRKAFSVGLGSKAEEEGSILFGAVDTSKYTGSLARLPIIPPREAPDGVPRYWINLESISLTPPSKNARVYENTTTPVFLDTGATLTLLPQTVTDAIASDFGSDGLGENGFYEVACPLHDTAGSLDFAFDGVTIAVPHREMIRKLPSNPPQCYLGIVPSGEFLLLGDTFMRSAYAVFDLAENNVYMAQYVNCGNSPQALTAKTDFNSLPGGCENPNAGALEGNTATDAGGSPTSGDAAAGTDTTTRTVAPTPAAAGTRLASDALPRASFLALFVTTAWLLAME